ncbi:CCR4-Not complex 3'-5'-exoribonuclease subunit Ccr4 (Carbon catabolite repressor protein 4) (Cytoplasmic deadenylase) (Glucose-repressible alcohol dehydrogenase transcriptional effector) [Durusdinium trenchii]|uniref:CCR4-Not complex 3'-5'-exoribonuclease subunit Ccr4 (Carbon catabolite repressor protein 4) (Cytoplasmic deadenylase) (Glucose-repressible alcohol dehydrogenase transcriptional effector) n=2 Tax=Durusdinium trenchii TaxID=1381693 RepID=A0ABP0L8S4_9DINO
MDPSALRELGLQTSLDDPPLLLRKSVHKPKLFDVPLEFESEIRASNHLPELRICTWNVLAPSYALQKSFPDVKPEYLKISHRRKLLYEVISLLNADAICLQDIEGLEEWQAHLVGLGYATAFAQRPGRADGCLIGCVDTLSLSFDDCLAMQQLPLSVHSRFARKNVALVVELDLEGRRFLLATTHLYWGSEHEDVRSWQLQVLLEHAATRFGCQKPLALCGDLNMLSSGDAYKFLRHGSLEVPRKFRNVERFLVDRDISKAAKPLRLLGLDVSVESPEEREERPEAALGLRIARVPVVTRAAREARVLVSASKRLVNRADAALAYFIDAREFELSLAKLCIDLAVDLGPERFFTRCVKCNGLVLPLASNEKEQDRATAFGAPANGIPLFTCTLCGQIYWFSHDLGSASARARLQVENLVNLVEELKRATPSDAAELGEGVPTESRPDKAEAFSSARFLRDGGGRLEHPWSLRSAFEDVEEDGAVSNSKYGFHGCIDYIWLSPEFRPSRRLRLPKVADFEKEPGKPLPSMVSSTWPSDHWPLAVDLVLS